MTVRIGDLALAAGVLTAAQLEHAKAVQKADGSRLGAALVGLGYLTEEQVCGSSGRAAAGRATAPATRAAWASTR
jgi:hypothetical protein